MKNDLVKLRSGEMAPDLALRSAASNPVRVSDYRNRENVILLFARPGEAVSLQRLLADLEDRQADLAWEHTAVIVVLQDPAQAELSIPEHFPVWIDSEDRWYRLMFGDQPEAPAAYVALDRFGEVIHFGPISGPEGDVIAQDLLEIVQFVELLCPE